MRVGILRSGLMGGKLGKSLREPDVSVRAVREVEPKSLPMQKRKVGKCKERISPLVRCCRRSESPPAQ